MCITYKFSEIPVNKLANEFYEEEKNYADIGDFNGTKRKYVKEKKQIFINIYTELKENESSIASHCFWNNKYTIVEWKRLFDLLIEVTNYKTNLIKNDEKRDELRRTPNIRIFSKLIYADNSYYDNLIGVFLEKAVDYATDLDKILKKVTEKKFMYDKLQNASENYICNTDSLEAMKELSKSLLALYYEVFKNYDNVFDYSFFRMSAILSYSCDILIAKLLNKVYLKKDINLLKRVNSNLENLNSVLKESKYDGNNTLNIIMDFANVLIYKSKCNRFSFNIQKIRAIIDFKENLDLNSTKIISGWTNLTLKEKMNYIRGSTDVDMANFKKSLKKCNDYIELIKKFNNIQLDKDSPEDIRIVYTYILKSKYKCAETKRLPSTILNKISKNNGYSDKNDWFFINSLLMSALEIKQGDSNAYFTYCDNLIKIYNLSITHASIHDWKSIAFNQPMFMFNIINNINNAIMCFEI